MCVCALCKAMHVCLHMLCREVCVYVQGCACVPTSGCVSLHEGAWVCAVISATGLDCYCGPLVG